MSAVPLAARRLARSISARGVTLAALCACAFVSPAGISAQGAVAGRVATASGLPLDGVYLVVRPTDDTVRFRASATDRLGRFHVGDLAPGEYELLARHIGYGDERRRVRVRAAETVRLEIVLEEQAVALAELAVEARRARARFEREAGATIRRLEASQIRRIPGVAEADVLRAVELLPGVISTSDYTSAYNVRGGSSDQNLILLDGLPVYNPFHLGGVFSVFNADMVKRTELYAGGFPAQFGGRLSSVLSIESDAGSTGADVVGGVSLLAGRAAVGAALPRAAEERLGLRSARGRISVRRSYLDQLMRPFFDFPYHLTDFQLYGEAWTRGDARLSVTGYTGRDVLDLSVLETFPLELRWSWGNDVAGVRWVSALGARGTFDALAGYSGFSSRLHFPEYDDTQLRSRIDHGLARADVELRRGEGRWRLGADANLLRYDNLFASGGTVFRQGRGQGALLGAHAQLDVRRGAWLVELGARGEGWLPAGEPARVLASPRAAVKRFVGEDMAIKLAAGRYTQYAHSVRDEELPLGIDIWVLAGQRAPHAVSDQVQLGMEGFAGPAWSFGVEAFARRFEGIITNNLADDPNDPTDDLLGGDGLAYGADLFVNREIGRVRPMLTLSWMRAARTFPDFRSGEVPPPSVTYPPIFDRRLDIDLLVMADLPRRLDFTARVHLGTGLPYTRPLGGYVYYDYGVVDGVRRPHLHGEDAATGVLLGERNAERYPPYQRVDASMRRSGDWRGGTLTWYVEVLNLLNRRNVLFYFYEYDRDPPVRSGISMFPLLPTLGVEFRF
jgi:hypothetical protein